MTKTVLMRLVRRRRAALALLEAATDPEFRQLLEEELADVEARLAAGRRGLVPRPEDATGERIRAALAGTAPPSPEFLLSCALAGRRAPAPRRGRRRAPRRRRAGRQRASSRGEDGGPGEPAGPPSRGVGRWSS